MATKSMTFKRARTPHYDDPAAVGQACLRGAGGRRPEPARARLPGLQRGLHLADRARRARAVAPGDARARPPHRGLRAGARLRHGDARHHRRRARARRRGSRGRRRAKPSGPAPTRRSHGRPRRPRDALDSLTDAPQQPLGSRRWAATPTSSWSAQGSPASRPPASLAQAGRGVVLVEQFGLGHDRGSSHGASRIFRLSYPDPHYVRLAQGALQSWRELEAEVGEELIVTTGGLDFGPVAVENARALAACGVATSCSPGPRWPGAGRSSPSRRETVLYHADGGVTLADRAYRRCSRARSRRVRSCSTSGA